MKKLVLLATALAMVSGSALAADMRVKAVKAPPPVAFDPWDIAFGSSITNDYVFRGITQSNHKPSVAAYFEPRYNVTKDLQLYVGLAGASISFPNRAAAEIDIYGGIRPTFGMFAFDFGVWGYLYPGGACQLTALPARCGCAFRSARNAQTNFLFNGNVAKKNVSFLKPTARSTYTLNDMFAIGANEYYSPNFLNSRRLGQLRVDHRQVHRAELDLRHQRPRHVHLRRVRPAVARNLRFASTERLHQSRLCGTVPERHQVADYNTWNIGVGFTYKVFTLDIRYSDTNLSKGDCNAFTSDFAHPRQHHRSFRQPRSRRSIRAASAPTGAARPASSSSRLT